MLTIPSFRVHEIVGGNLIYHSRAISMMNPAPINRLKKLHEETHVICHCHVTQGWHG
jgi:hypothetical protein